jgi:hypothetical protein
MWQAVSLPEGERAGLLTRAAFLTRNANPIHPSPVKRGVFVFDRLLCAPLPDPPADVNTDPPEPVDGQPQTNRDRYEAHESDPSCFGCHERIDGIGFGFEGYDSIGRFRTTDNGFPVDDTSALVETDVDGPFDGAVELSERLAESAQVERCLVTQWFRFAYGRLETGQDVEAIDRLHQAFVASGRDIRELIVTIATSEDFRMRTVSPP